MVERDFPRASRILRPTQTQTALSVLHFCPVCMCLYVCMYACTQGNIHKWISVSYDVIVCAYTYAVLSVYA